jgi:hypothetical protein
MDKNSCKVEGCNNKKIRSRGLCSTHYYQQRRNGFFGKKPTDRELLIKQGKCLCPKCDEVKSVEDFCKDFHNKRGIAAYCRECLSKKGKTAYVNHKDRYVKAYLKRKYGMTLTEYDEMLKSQGGVCKICKKSPTDNKRLCVDHCHKTLKVRGILCDGCNLTIGKMNDDVNLLRSAIDYLEKAA